MGSELNRILLEVLNRYCPTSRLTEQAKQALAELGFGVLGYNVKVIPSRYDGGERI